MYPRPSDILLQKFANFATLYPEVASSEGLFSIQDSVSKFDVKCIASGLEQGKQVYRPGATINFGQRSTPNTYSINDGNTRFFAAVLSGIRVDAKVITLGLGNIPVSTMIWDLNQPS
jgi:hypothetical protein